MEIVLATQNKGKIRELNGLLRPMNQGFMVIGLSSFPEIGPIAEPGRTFAENALHKAFTVCQSTGLPALADDSGLEVDALGGRPGVYSARFSGPEATDADNNSKLLLEMRGVPEKQRSARFRCVLAACLPGGGQLSAEGIWEGWIALKARGSNGFGYDPLFVDAQTGLTAAQMTAEEKNARSHRALALRGFLRDWPAFARQASEGLSTRKG